jgi:23S rRNA (adenine2030-N6)-methyltransferase
MLSYQHAYHAGNLADLHKHMWLAWTLNYLTQKDKPLSYLETHSGRGLYDLSGAEATKTGEAAQGVLARQTALPTGHPLLRHLEATRSKHGENAYPGSPMIAAQALRPGDTMHLAEAHPGEIQHLRRAMGKRAKIYAQDGFEMAQSLCPPTPRRGMMLIDPSYEIKADYDNLPKFINAINRKWNIGIIALWYPILTDNRQSAMVKTLQQAHPQGLCHQVTFPPARPGHGMIGSGWFMINPPFGHQAHAAELKGVFPV